MDATPLTTNSVTFDLLARIYDPPKPLVLDKVQTRPDNYIIRFIQAVGLIAAYALALQTILTGIVFSPVAAEPGFPSSGI